MTTVNTTSSQEVQVAPAQRKSLLAAMAAKYNMEPDVFRDTIKATVMPAGATNEQMAAFLLVANEYDLNPITREIYAFPARNGGVTPVVGIDGWINLAQRRPEFDGMNFEYMFLENGDLDACLCSVYRKDRNRPVEVTEYMSECRRGTDPWKTHPRRMLRHKAAIQAIRYAFGFSGIKDEDDAEVIYANAQVVEEAPSQASAEIMDRARKLGSGDPASGETRIMPAKGLRADLEQVAIKDFAEEHTPPPVEERQEDARLFPADRFYQERNRQKKEAIADQEWPRKDEAGVWRDSRGLYFDYDIHSMPYGDVPSVTKYGVFVKKRGCDPDLHEAREKEQWEAIKANADKAARTGQQEEEISFGFPEINTAISRATTLDELADAEDMLNAFDGPEDQLEELKMLVDDRKGRIERLLGGSQGD